MIWRVSGRGVFCQSYRYNSHYMDPSLLDSNGAAGTAFQNYLNSDPKLLQYSAAVFKKVMGQLIEAKPDILLVPGDITKDGEKLDHQVMAGFFEQLRSHGITVFVMPGNQIRIGRQYLSDPSK